ncbi:MAG: metallophosphoesterase [Polyangiales bacterium]|nr:metallophosphoesterase [Myxococcales bacterium]
MSERANGFRLRRFAGHHTHTEQASRIRVAHLTDIHVGAVTPYAVQRRAVDMTNQEKPDVVVMTGDFVCHSQLYLDQLEDVIQRFDAPVFAVLGNHDYWSGAKEVRRSLKRAGAEVLDNANTVVELGHERLQLVGVDDAYTGHASRERATKGMRTGIATVGLSHIAEEADGLWHDGVPLVLSGHTHAGQITVARLHELSVGRLVGHKYVHGLYGARHPEGVYPGAVYVGAGIGAAVIPVRIGERAKREITLFDLGEKPGSFDEPFGEAVPLPGRPPSEKTKARRHLRVAKKSTGRDSEAPGDPAK